MRGFNFILASATTTNCACSDLKKVLTITWIVSNAIFTLEEGYEAIHHTNLVTVPKLGHRKRDGAPPNLGLHPVFIKQYNNLYFLFLYIHL